MADEPDYYADLEVSPDADEAELRISFRRLARRYHPDVAGTGDLVHMQRLNVAYQTLSDPKSRSRYDLSRGIHQEPIAQPYTSDPLHAGRPPAAHGSSARGQARTAAHAEPSPTSARTGAIHHSPGPLRRIAALAASDPAPVTSVAFACQGTLAGLGLIDGRVLMWDVATERHLHTLSFGSGSPAGVLQELRLSPSGRLAIAWGFLLGTRVWQVDDERPLWTAGVNGPSGAMDAALQDEPPLLRLALPDAPLAPAHDDPFRWAYEGRLGSGIYSRPLSGAVDPAWARPRRCLEVRIPQHQSVEPEPVWRIHQRVLSVDGHQLLTFSTGQHGRTAGAGFLRVWALERRMLLEKIGPRRVANLVIPPGVAWFPLAVTPDVSWVAIGHFGRSIRMLAPGSPAQRTIHTGPLAPDTRLSLSPDGSLLAVAHGSQLDLWQTTDGRCVQQVEFADELTAMSFAGAAGRPLLGVGLSNGLAEVWG
jgi:hypothetical protein